MLSVVIPTTRGIPKIPLDCEVLIQREKGLVNARNLGWQRARGKVVAFIDDDVILSTNWADEIRKAFKDPSVGCLIGKTVLLGKENRDNDWSNPILKKFLDRIGNVQACNMAFRKSVLKEVGGFDPIYDLGVGEWSEPDLVLKVRGLGYKVKETAFPTLVHCPSQSGIYADRAKYSYQRMRNFHTFRKRWLKWDTNLVLVTIIFYAYWFYKFLRTGNRHWLGGLIALR